ncbi:hypothetical protein [Mucilaginibacter segetis]|uniref:Uncharacterized protein n=1 Tax=Mucilaginibacter segetis TaxID=2793071 RepID=A0A934UNG0_9SPHI|nr:hypothetical protein [Mucilaginibacter segetis]MBK0380753.1 hypothetical protein [Mucilaginibacter segetis]
MKISRIAAKTIVRIFLILLLAALIPFIKGDNEKLKHLYLMPAHIWTLAFPILLILGFIVLLVMCTLKKYSKPDLNWLLFINTLVLIAYGVTLYISISRLIS